MELEGPLPCSQDPATGPCQNLYVTAKKGFLTSAWKGLDTYLRTYLLTYSLVKDIIWKADCHSACQKISCFLMEHEGSLLCSHKPATGPYPESAESSSPHSSLSP
jgi:hypothetical protein